jgi:hypothetical protein
VQFAVPARSISLFFVFTRGAKKTLSEGDDDWSDGKAAWIAVVAAAGCGILVGAIAVPLLHRRTDKMFNE